MVSRENAVIAACIAAAFGLPVALTAVTTPPTWASAAVLVGVGVVAPQLLNEYLDARGR